MDGLDVVCPRNHTLHSQRLSDMDWVVLWFTYMLLCSHTTSQLPCISNDQNVKWQYKAPQQNISINIENCFRVHFGWHCTTSICLFLGCCLVTPLIVLHHVWRTHLLSPVRFLNTNKHVQQTHIYEPYCVVDTYLRISNTTF